MQTSALCPTPLLTCLYPSVPPPRADPGRPAAGHPPRGAACGQGCGGAAARRPGQGCRRAARAGAWQACRWWHGLSVAACAPRLHVGSLSRALQLLWLLRNEALGSLPCGCATGSSPKCPPPCTSPGAAAAAQRGPPRARPLWRGPRDSGSGGGGPRQSAGRLHQGHRHGPAGKPPAFALLARHLLCLIVLCAPPAEDHTAPAAGPVHAALKGLATHWPQPTLSPTHPPTPPFPPRRRARPPRCWRARCAPRACGGRTCWPAASRPGRRLGWGCARRWSMTRRRWTPSGMLQRRVSESAGLSCRVPCLGRVVPGGPCSMLQLLVARTLRHAAYPAVCQRSGQPAAWPAVLLPVCTSNMPRSPGLPACPALQSSKRLPASCLACRTRAPLPRWRACWAAPPTWRQTTTPRCSSLGW